MPISSQIKTQPKYLVDRIRLADGQQTTLRKIVFKRDQINARLVYFDTQIRLIDWCEQTKTKYAINGGFFVSETAEQLGELWLDSQRKDPTSSKFQRGCAYFPESGQLILGKRTYLPERPSGDLLEAGPLLVKEGVSLIKNDLDPEGFHTESTQFDSDISSKRHPRAAIATNGEYLWALVCEGRTKGEAGMSLEELGDYLIDQGATEALNLDGGSSASLIVERQLVNQPRIESKSLPRGRSIRTAITFD